MVRHDTQFAAAARWRLLPAVALLAAVAGACRGQKAPAAEVDAPAPLPVNPSPVPRPVRGLPDPAFHVEWLANDVPSEMKAGATQAVNITLKNVGALPWPDPDSTSYEPPQSGAVRLACRWWPSGSSPAPSAYGRRADLQRLLQPGQAVTLSLTVIAPATAGEYGLQCDLVQEMVAWFETKGAPRLMVPVRVRAN